MIRPKLPMIRLLLRGIVWAAVGAALLPAMLVAASLGLGDATWDTLANLALAMLMPGAAIGFFAAILPALRRRAKAHSGR